MEELYPEKTIYEREDDKNNDNKKIIEDKKEDKKEEKKEDKKEEKKYESSSALNEDIVKFLNNILNEKEEYKNELNGIKNKIEFLLEEYKDSKKEIEKLILTYNNLIKNNMTSYENKDKDSSSKFYLIEILILIVFLAYLIKFLYNKSSFNARNNNNNEANYSDLNGFGYTNSDIELSSKSSKLLM